MPVMTLMLLTSVLPLRFPLLNFCVGDGNNTCCQPLESLERRFLFGRLLLGRCGHCATVLLCSSFASSFLLPLRRQDRPRSPDSIQFGHERVRPSPVIVCAAFGSESGSFLQSPWPLPVTVLYYYKEISEYRFGRHCETRFGNEVCTVSRFKKLSTSIFGGIARLLSPAFISPILDIQRHGLGINRKIALI